MENQSILHDKKVVNTMRKVSKLGIYLPSILLIVAIIIVFTAPRKDPKLMQQQLIALTPTITPTPTIKISLNLRGPFICDYQSKTSSVSASIKDKQIAVDFIEATQSSHFIVRDNCLYAWDTNKAVGQKTCGLGTILDTADFLSSMGLLDIGSLMNMVPPNIQGVPQKKMPTSNSGVEKFLRTCIKKEPLKEVFEVPTDRYFIEPTVAPTPRI